MTSAQDVQQFIGRTAVDSEGNKVGKIGQIYLDDHTGMPRWVTVATGLFGTRQSFAPLYGAQASGDEVTLAVSKEQIKDAPNVDDDGRIEASEQDALYRHYAGYLGEQQTGHGPGGQAEAQGRDTSGPVTDDAMTRSEEQLRVGTETVEAGRARLRKYVVTENVSTTVPVSHEEVRVEREPITGANRDAALSGEPISEEEHEVTLQAERPVVAKEAVPVERVRLATQTVTEDAAVNETIRKEQIEEPAVESNPRHARR
jgi:uncharacterized protein (TIGR02271 family)